MHIATSAVMSVSSTEAKESITFWLKSSVAAVSVEKTLLETFSVKSAVAVAFRFIFSGAGKASPVDKTRGLLILFDKLSAGDGKMLARDCDIEYTLGAVDCNFMEPLPIVEFLFSQLLTIKLSLSQVAYSAAEVIEVA
jgi:hypothetical protein